MLVVVWVVLGFLLHPQSLGRLRRLVGSLLVEPRVVDMGVGGWGLMLLDVPAELFVEHARVDWYRACQVSHDVVNKALELVGLGLRVV